MRELGLEPQCAVVVLHIKIKPNSCKSCWSWSLKNPWSQKILVKILIVSEIKRHLYTKFEFFICNGF